MSCRHFFSLCIIGGRTFVVNLEKVLDPDSEVNESASQKLAISCVLSMRPLDFKRSGEAFDSQNFGSRRDSSDLSGPHGGFTPFTMCTALFLRRAIRTIVRPLSTFPTAYCSLLPCCQSQATDDPLNSLNFLSSRQDSCHRTAIREAD